MDIHEIVESEKHFFRTGVTRGVDFRIDMLKKFRKAIIENDELISAALKADLNKQPFESYMCETGLLLEEINFHIKRLKKWSKTRRVKSGIGQLPGKSYVCPEPYGVVLIMAPWNYPVQLCLMPLVGAISAGNCAVVKPSAYAPESSRVISKLIESAFPTGFVTAVEGGRDANKALLDEPFDYIFFTGSVAVGKVKAFEDVDRKITRLAERAYKKKKMAANEYRHRAIVWGVQSHFYMDFLVWLLNCWGIVPLTDMLSMVSTKELVTEDTPENREQAYYDMAWLTENMIMRNRTHGGYKVLLDELWEYCKEFNADMVVLWEHMSCKALDGMHGMFEERAREYGIHLVWVSHDLFDPRVISRQGVRDQINNYMRTVMGEEPVDPSLEVLHDEESW